MPKEWWVSIRWWKWAAGSEVCYSKLEMGILWCQDSGIHFNLLPLTLWLVNFIAVLLIVIYYFLSVCEYVYLSKWMQKIPSWISSFWKSNMRPKQIFAIFLVLTDSLMNMAWISCSNCGRDCLEQLPERDGFHSSWTACLYRRHQIQTRLCYRTGRITLR